jgi:hypothetical protein
MHTIAVIAISATNGRDEFDVLLITPPFSV